MKVKIFTGGTNHLFDKVESEVNEWLKKNSKKIKVISLYSTTACGINELHKGFVNLTIVIFYKPVK